MLVNEKEQEVYIKENYPEITDSRIDSNDWDIFCENCKVVRGFSVVREDYAKKNWLSREAIDWEAPKLIYFRCPVCHSYKMWFVFSIREEVDVEGRMEGVVKYYRITSIPAEGLEDIDELPTEPSSLRIAYRQAIRAMDASAYIAAAAMFRRALQIITRNILNIKPGKLADELNASIGMEYNGVKITSRFADNAYIIKEAGNQGAHPDKDPDLLAFTQQDAEDLQKIFMELASELFVIPEAQRKAKEEFLKRRKIIIK